MRQLEYLKAWTEGKRLARDAYRVTLLPALKHHFSLCDQIRSAALSVPANIVEGYSLGTRPQLKRHLRISLASTRELDGHIEFASDLDLIPADDIKRLRGSADLVIRLLVGLLRKLER